MKFAAGILLLLAASTLAGTPAPAAAAGGNSCIDCHRELEPRMAAPTEHFAEDIHAVRGLGCVGCHGGDASDPDITAMDPDKGFRGAPKRSEIAEWCAKCHADAAFMKRYNPQPYVFSMAEFRTSVHCKKISEGDTKVATCTNCHGVHGILPHKDPRSPVYPTNVPATCSKCHNSQYMKGRTVPTNQYALYVNSVHGKALLEKGDLSAPACNDCHGNHGAVPPNTRDISVVCGNCHGREGELFAKSGVSHALELEGKRGCATCHGNHDIQRPTDAMIGLGPGGVCGQCHTPESPGGRATAILVPQFHGLKIEIAEADSLLAVADRLGMDTEAGRGLLREADDQLVNVRVSLHTFDRAQISDAITASSELATKSMAQARALLADWRTRRVGLGGSLVVILILIALLVYQIRRIESPRA